MILTFKIRHDRDFSRELALAKQVADFAIEYHTISSKDVKHIGLKSVISNQILRKYGRNKTIKKVSNVNLVIPNQGIKQEGNKIKIPCLKFEFEHQIKKTFSKINQIEIDNEFVFVSVNVKEKPEIVPETWIGIDRNTTGHAVVVGNPATGKIMKLGKRAHHIHNKYKGMRRRLQKQGKYREAKRVKNRESRIVRDLNQKISTKVVQYAVENQVGIKVEALQGIRNRTKIARSFKYSLNSWSFRQFQTMLEYKAKMFGIPVAEIAPQYTSQDCSKCGLRGNRNGKKFSCPNCGHVENADVNASFNIALRPPLVEGVSRLHEERDSCNGSTDTPEAQYHEG